MKRVFSNSLIYVLCGLLIKGVNFFLVPFYTAYLSTSDYGVISLTSNFLASVSVLASCSLFNAVFRFYSDLKSQKEKLKRFYGTMILFTVIATVSISLLLIVFKDILTTNVFQGIPFFPTLSLMILSVTFYSQYTIYENILKSQQQSKKYAIVVLSYFCLTVFLNFLFIVFFRLGAAGVLLANFLAYSVFTIVFWGDMLLGNQITLCIDRELLLEALKYSVPLIPHNLSTLMTALLSKLFIGENGTLSAIGIYTIASQFGDIADTIQGYIDNAYGPWLYNELSDFQEHKKELIHRSTKLLSFAIGFVMLGISYFSKDYILLLLRPEFREAWRYVPFIVMVYLIKMIYYFYVEVLFYYKEASRKIFIITLSSSIINVIFSYLLIREYGIIGTILADMISMLFRVLLVVVLSKRYANIGLQLNTFLRTILIVVIFTTLGLFRFYNVTNHSIFFSFSDFIYRLFFLFLYMLVVLMFYRENIVSILKGSFLKGVKR